MSKDIVSLVRDTLVSAGSTFRPDKKEAYKRAIAAETNENAKWVLEQVLENAEVAEKNKSPLCDDTGIPHLVLEVGPDCAVTGKMLADIKEGIKQGLRALPGRPMGIMGDDIRRIDQSGGLNEDPAGVEPAPILLRPCKENVIRIHILMFGGGPAIRAKTYRVFHKHNAQVVLDEIVSWATESVAQLGCTPCTLAVGIGRIGALLNLDGIDCFVDSFSSSLVGVGSGSGRGGSSRSASCRYRGSRGACASR